MNRMRPLARGLNRRFRAILTSTLVLLASLHASMAATLTFTYEYGTPAQATGKPAYPYTGFSEYFSTITTVIVTCSDPTANLFYTIDGTTPTTASTPVPAGGKIVVLRKQTLKVKGFAVGSGTEVATKTEEFHATGMISAGYSHALALPFTGASVFAWGDNAGSKLGLNYPTVSTTDQSSKITVVDSVNTTLTNIKAVAAGSTFSLALTYDGLVRSWGTYADGQLGINAVTLAAINAENRIGTVKVKGTANQLQDVRDIVAGEYHALAIVGSNREVWGWGRNAEGQLGIGNGTGWASDQSGAVHTINVAGANLSGAVQVAAGKNHSAALLDNGDIYVWGYNYNGQSLGTSSTVDNVYRATQMTTFYPGTTPLVPAKARAIACGDNFTLAVRDTDGTVWGWGNNGNGQLGNNATAASQLLPVQVVKPQTVNPSLSEPLTDIVQVEAGLAHAIALDSNGGVWTWGLQTSGRLGNGLTTAANKSRAELVTVLPGGSTDHVVAVAAGTDFSMALTEQGRIYTWGSRSAGRLGDGSTSGSSGTPSTAAGYQPLVSNQPPVVSFLSTNATTGIRSIVFSLVLGATDQDNNLTNLDLLVDGVVYQSFSSAPAGAVQVPNLPVGPHTFTLHAVDAAGVAATPVSLNVTVTAPTVTLSLQTAGTVEPTSLGGSVTPGKFRLAVSTVQATALPVYVTMTGTAANGVDYQTISTPVSIPAGQSYLDVNVSPLFDRLTEGTETVILTLETNSEYIRGGSVFTRTVTLDDRPPVPNPVIQAGYGANTRLSLVAVTCTDALATIRYTTNGTDPTPSSTVLTTVPAILIGIPPNTQPANVGYIRVPLGATLKIKASATNKIDSEVVTRVFNGKSLVAAGDSHSFAVTPDGKVWAWGRNDYGQLGLGDTADYGYPHEITALLSTPVSIAAANTYSAAALEDGHAVIWGTYGGFSSLTPVRFKQPVGSPAVSTDVTGIVQVAASPAGVLLRKSDGSVLEYALGNVDNPANPGLVNAVEIDANNAGFVALKSDGTVVGWSAGASLSAPTTGQGGVSIVQISSGANHAIGLLANTKTTVWGDDTLGQHGDDWVIPFRDVEGFYAVAAGGDTTFAGAFSAHFLTAGENDHGQRAIGSTSASNGVPYWAAAPASLSALCLGGKHGLAIQDDGSEVVFWSWGHNGYGQLGMDDEDDRNVITPILVWHIDTDSDGMIDYWENLHGLDPNVNDASEDPDADGLSNLLEFQFKTDPQIADTDADGIPDGWEVNYSLDPKTNDSSEDPDLDGASNLIEYRIGTYPKAADSDGDTIPDGAEYTLGYDPLDYADAALDPDKDHLSNLQEYLAGTNPWPEYTAQFPANPSYLLSRSTASPKQMRTDGSGVWYVEDAKTGTLLSSFLPTDVAQATAINASGYMSGMLRTWEQTEEGPVPVYLAGVFSPSGVFTPVPGVSSSATTGINDAGDVVGHDQTTGSYYKWNYNTSTLTYLTLPSYAAPSGLNNANELIGMDWILRGETAISIPTGTLVSGLSEDGTAIAIRRNSPSDPNPKVVTIKRDNISRELSLAPGEKQLCAVGNSGQIILNREDGVLHIARGHQESVLTPVNWSSFPQKQLKNINAYSEYGIIRCELVDAPGASPATSPQQIYLIASVADSDSDGMSDDFEAYHFGVSGGSPGDDADNDGLSNLQEYNLGTDPTLADSDDDGMPDGWEQNNLLNPLNAEDAESDLDNDSLNNLSEYWIGTSPYSSDTDVDYLPDGWEVANGTYPTITDNGEDPDSDGRTNYDEYLQGTNPLVAD